MTFSEAMASQAAPWLSIWLNVMFVGAFVLPLTLLIWKPTRLIGVICFVASIIAAVGIVALYERMGYVKILGLPHIIIWTPLAIYLWRKMKSEEITKAPRVIKSLILATLLVSLAFDYTDAIRYILGERTPTVLPASMMNG